MAEDKLYVSFVCQQCSAPLKLDDSLNSFSEHISAELNLPIHSNLNVDLESQTTSFDTYIRPCRLTDSINGTNGFMLISDESDSELLSHQFRVRAALFDKLSGFSEIDHPICDECVDYLMECFDQIFKDTQADYDDYLKYYKTLEKETNEPRIEELQKELNKLLAEEQNALRELNKLCEQEAKYLNKLKEVEAETKEREEAEEVYRRKHTTHTRNRIMADDEARSLQCQLSYTQAQLEKLKKTNIFNATFHIWYKGHFGTINNFCLGRLPSSPVDWSEINAAWGQTALLLDALARKINLTFERYKLVPFGNHSFIKVLNEPKEFPLYGAGGVKYYWDPKFDCGMAAFLDCLQQFQEHVERLEEGNKTFRFPYRTNKGKIEDKDTSYSIKIQLNSEEQWTKALKFMLTNLKWGLTWISSQLNNDVEESMQTEN